MMKPEDEYIKKRFEDEIEKKFWEEYEACDCLERHDKLTHIVEMINNLFVLKDEKLRKHALLTGMKGYFDDLLDYKNSEVSFLKRRISYIERELKSCLKEAEKAGDNKEALGYKTVQCIIKNSESRERMDYDDEIERNKKRKRK